MTVTKDVAEREYESLHQSHKQKVAGILMDLRRRYLMSGINVDIPYFFWSLNKPLFIGDEHIEFLEITDSYDFAVNAIYLISRFINKTNSPL